MKKEIIEKINGIKVKITTCRLCKKMLITDSKDKEKYCSRCKNDMEMEE